MKSMRVVAIILLLVLVAIFVSIAAPSLAEEQEIQMYVIASQLNGRSLPSKKSQVEARFDYGDIVLSTGRWSDDMKWIEVKGGDSGLCWCKADYLTERLAPFTIENEHSTKLKIRRWPEGKVISSLSPHKTTKITQVVLGWGKCSRGWIDLGYVVELEGD